MVLRYTQSVRFENKPRLYIMLVERRSRREISLMDESTHTKDAMQKSRSLVGFARQFYDALA